jgi:methionine aminotransferase
MKPHRSNAFLHTAVILNVTAIKIFQNESDKDLAIRLTKEYGIATIPMSAFYKDGQDNKVLRFCFAKKEETLEKAVEKLATLK